MNRFATLFPLILKLASFKEKFFPGQNFDLFIACSCGDLVLF